MGLVKKKKPNRKLVVKKLDAIFSQYIRLKNSTNGLATCVTCGDTKPWKEMQNGHFYSRSRYATRWDENNCNVQCMKDNIFLKGHYIAYTKYMLDKHGRDFVDDLEVRSKQLHKISTVELEEKIVEFTEKVKQLQK